MAGYRIGIGNPGPSRPFTSRMLPKWRTRDHKARVLFWGLLALSAMLAMVVYAALVTAALVRGPPYVNAVFLFWGWSRFLHVISPASLIYDPHVLAVFEHGLAGAQPKNLPFVYPPSLLLLIWPLGLLHPVPALLLWISVSLALYVWACWHRRWGGRIAMSALVAPSTLAAVYYPETSLLVAALMIGGCRLIGRRPVLAGVLFGLLAFKPQFGLLIPVALIAARQWRSVLAAGATVLLSAIASGQIFGWATWAQLPSALVGVSRLLARLPSVTKFSPTVTASLRMLGAGPLLTDAAQVVAVVFVAVAVWVCFRRGATALATAALLVGAVIAAPYAFFYDLTMVSYAVLAVVTERHESHEPFATGELLVLILAIALPLLILFNPLGAPWGMIVLLPLFGLILHRSVRVGITAAAQS